MSQHLTGPPTPMLLKEWIPSASRRSPIPAPTPTRPPTSTLSDRLRQSPPHARSSPHSLRHHAAQDRCSTSLSRRSVRVYLRGDELGPARPIRRQQHTHLVPPIPQVLVLRPTIMRHDPGLAASPPVRSIHRVASEWVLSFPFLVRYGRTTCSRSGGAPRRAILDTVGPEHLPRAAREDHATPRRCDNGKRSPQPPGDGHATDETALLPAASTARSEPTPSR